MNTAPLIDSHTDVLIIGAGISGLMVAVNLLRHGIRPTIIDRKKGPDRSADPIFLNARSLEILRQLNLDDEVLRHGTRLELAGAGSLTAFPMVLAIPVATFGKLLIDQLTRGACQILWDTEAGDLFEREEGVDVRMKRPDPTLELSRVTQIQRASWLIGADGADSLVRQYMGASFKAAGSSQSQKIQISIKPVSPRTNASDTSLQTAVRQVLSLISDRLRAPARGAGIASQLMSRRALLVGDAAHVHASGPLTGVNPCLSGAQNLSWKLAAVVSGRVDRNILYTYETEQSKAARFSLTLDAIAHFALQARAATHALKTKLLEGSLKILLKTSRRQSYYFSALSGLASNHRNSILSLHHSRAERIKAGDRFPYLPLFDERTKTWTDSHRIFNASSFVLVILGNVPSGYIHTLRKWVQSRYPQGIGMYYIPFSASNKATFDCFGIGPSELLTLLVRPDMYLAYVSSELNTSLLENYLTEILAWNHYRPFD